MFEVKERLSSQCSTNLIETGREPRTENGKRGTREGDKGERGLAHPTVGARPGGTNIRRSERWATRSLRHEIDDEGEMGGERCDGMMTSGETRVDEGRCRRQPIPPNLR